MPVLILTAPYRLPVRGNRIRIKSRSRTQKNLVMLQPTPYAPPYAQPRLIILFFSSSARSRLGYSRDGAYPIG